MCAYLVAAVVGVEVGCGALNAKLACDLEQRAPIGEGDPFLEVSPRDFVHDVLLLALRLGEQAQPVGVHRVAQRRVEVELVAGRGAQLLDARPRGRAVELRHALSPALRDVCLHPCRVEEEGLSGDGEAELRARLGAELSVGGVDPLHSHESVWS
eukprot:COSAG06_NODE_5878_length_3231_cov_2.531609_1_plen_155_part_00